MRKVLLISLVFLMVMTSPAQAERLRVVVGILPVQYFVDQIGGEYVESVAVVQPGADPHTFEPKPSQMSAIARADLYCSIGLGFEETWIPRFKSANRSLAVVSVDAGIEKMPMAASLHEADHESASEAGHGDVDHEHEDGLDPHIWTSPPLVKQIAANILAALSDADPANRTAYQANFDAFIGSIERLDADLKSVLDGLGPDIEFMVYHPSWGYFAQAYHLTQVPVELEGKAPGPRQLAEVITFGRAHKIKMVFVQPQFSDKEAQVIANEIGGEVVKADPLAYEWGDNLRRITEAFGKVR